jgi:hypothetical protein
LVKTDKVMIWVLLGILLVGGLCLCCLGGAVALPFRWFGWGGPSAVAKTFLSSDPRVREKIGPDLEFGLLPSGSFQEINGEGRAQLEFSLRGSKGSGRASVTLGRAKGKGWQVEEAHLLTGGETIQLKGASPAKPDFNPLERPPDGQPREAIPL